MFVLAVNQVVRIKKNVENLEKLQFSYFRRFRFIVTEIIADRIVKLAIHSHESLNFRGEQIRRDFYQGHIIYVPVSAIIPANQFSLIDVPDSYVQDTYMLSEKKMIEKIEHYRNERKRLGITQDELSLALGYKKSNIGRIETPRFTYPSRKIIAKYFYVIDQMRIDRLK